MGEIVCKEPKAIDENRGLRRYLELFSLHKQLQKMVSFGLESRTCISSSATMPHFSALAFFLASERCSL